MQVTSHFSNRITIIRLSGRLDGQEVPIVRKELLKAAASAPAKVVVNLAHVYFIDSSGLAVLVQAMKYCQKQQGNLYLCDFGEFIEMIFELTKMNRAFRIFANEEEAIKAFEKSE